MCKRIFRFELEISNFHEIAPNSAYSQISYFLKYICNFLDQLLHPYRFHGEDMSEILFFIFASREQLSYCFPWVDVSDSCLYVTLLSVVYIGVSYNVIPLSAAVATASLSVGYVRVYEGLLQLLQYLYRVIQ